MLDKNKLEQKYKSTDEGTEETNLFDEYKKQIDEESSSTTIDTKRIDRAEDWNSLAHQTVGYESY